MAKLRDRSYGALFEESREALLEALAGAVEAHDRLRPFARETSDNEREESDDSDFLYDLARLNVQYLNQLARVGSNYAILGSRILEGVYEKVMPKAARGGGAGNPAQADKEAGGGGADKTAQADEEARRRPIFVPFETDESIRLDLPVHNPFDVVATINLEFTDQTFTQGRPVDRVAGPTSAAIHAAFGLPEPKARVALHLRAHERTTVPVTVCLLPKQLHDLPFETDYFNTILIQATPDRAIAGGRGARTDRRYVVVRRCAVGGL
jgi:hypothetical protein